MAYDFVKQVIEEYSLASAVFNEKMKGAFDGIFKTFFEFYPEIAAVKWNQYTPYFNDGEPCEFCVGEFSFYDKKNGNGEILDADYADGDGDTIYKKPSEYLRQYPEYAYVFTAFNEATARHREVAAGVEELEDILLSIPDEIYLAAFDDHVTVVATKDSIEAEEYSHD